MYMVFETEIIHEKQKAIIVSRQNHSFLDLLKARLQKASVEYFFSSRTPNSFKIFDYIFFINERLAADRIKKYPEKKFIFILLNQKDRRHHDYKIPNVKVVSVDCQHLEEADIDKLLWFAFSETGEDFMKLSPRSFSKPNPHSALGFDWRKFATRKFLFLAALFVIFVYHTLFVLPFLISAAETWVSYNRLKKEDFVRAEDSLQTAGFYLKLTKKLYTLPRSTFRLLGFALYPDNAIDLVGRSQTVMSEVVSLTKNGKQLATLLFLKNKTSVEKSDAALRLTLANRSLSVIEENLAVMAENLPSRFRLTDIGELLSQSQKIFDYLQRNVSSPTQKKFLLFFANNRELRPGGGFIGSFGILKMGDYSIDKLEIYDVYDADGQLTVKVDPPQPIAQFLNQPYWFLRDSNFSPDFLENYQRALFFLEKEMGLADFDGSILITTSAIENILAPFGDLYVPDYKETVNSQNFYLKTQIEVEQDFFPGSTQKRNFLSSLMNQIFINLDRVSLHDLGIKIKKSLDEKQIVAYSKEEGFQSFLDSTFWSGRVIEPKCNIQENCIIDYIFPYDANLGANKANYFVSKNMYLKTAIDNDGKISHVLSIQYKNSSPSLIFPTGLYRNYFQVLLPTDSLVESVTKNGVLIEEVDQADDAYKKVGFFFEVKPLETVEIKINYFLGKRVSSQKEIYQFIIQKQIGAANSDFVLELSPASNIQVLNQNFSPIVKDREIVYNTSLSTDKIFLIELVKQ